MLTLEHKISCSSVTQTKILSSYTCENALACFFPRKKMRIKRNSAFFYITTIVKLLQTHALLSQSV
jgi:hypothetical protein